MKEKIIESLNNFRRRADFKDKYGVFIDGAPVYFSTKNVYATPGSAKRVILNKTFRHIGTAAEVWEKDQQAKQALEELLKDGIIEIKKL